MDEIDIGTGIGSVFRGVKENARDVQALKKTGIQKESVGDGESEITVGSHMLVYRG